MTTEGCGRCWSLEVEREALRREVERLKQLLRGRGSAYQDLEYFAVEPDYGAPLPEEDDA